MVLHFFQVKDKCTSLVEINLIIKKVYYIFLFLKVSQCKFEQQKNNFEARKPPQKQGVKDKCTSLVEINLIIQKRNMDFTYDLCTIENKDLIMLVFVSFPYRKG
jgi:hypothetical protein